MTVTLQFSDVNCDKITGLSFALQAGESAVLRMASKEEKIAAIELAVGERLPDVGIVTLHGVALHTAPRGSIGWVPENGGLISNLKVWENVTLPLWYHGRRRSAVAEDKIVQWLAAMGLADEEIERFMASPVGRLTTLERKRAGLLRGLLLAPGLLVVDAGLFSGLAAELREAWVAVLDAFVRETEGRSVLVVANGDVALPWKIIG